MSDPVTWAMLVAAVAKVATLLEVLRGRPDGDGGEGPADHISPAAGIGASGEGRCPPATPQVFAFG